MYQQKQREQMNASSNFPGSSNSYTFASSNNGPNFAGSNNCPSPQNDPYLIRYGFSLRCNLDESSGKIQAKIENNGQERIEYAYRYDHKGHLTQVFVDGLQAEKYEFNSQGQRVLKLTKQRQNAIKYLYNDQGCLIQAGTTVFTYDQGGALASQQDGGRLMRFKYKETKLEQVILPDGAVIRYEYPDLSLYSAANQGAGPSAGQANTLPPNLPANPLGPMRKFKNNRLVAEYGWKNLFELNEYLDYELGLRYIFNYAQTNKRKNLGSKASQASQASLETLESIAICALNQKPGSLKTLLSEPDGPGSQAQGQARGQTQGQARAQTLVCGCDQVGTPKLFTQPSGQRVKQIDYDSFGVVQYDTYPELFIPIGFAGGLVDRDTGLVRFGFRDYMPELGRFTCPDPLGDTGGDHDLYDYCVDDPVNMVDPEGLRGGRLERNKESTLQKVITDIPTYVGVVKGGGVFLAKPGFNIAPYIADAVPTIMTHEEGPGEGALVVAKDFFYNQLRPVAIHSLFPQIAHPYHLYRGDYTHENIDFGMSTKVREGFNEGLEGIAPKLETIVQFGANPNQENLEKLKDEVKPKK